MLLRLPSGTTIAVPPFFFRQVPRADLEICSASVFHPDHITSRLCLDILDRELDAGPCDALLDVGCGSGILALLAAYKGVSFVAGLDIDRRAISMSRGNAEKNHLTRNAHWLLGTIQAVQRRFALITANLPYAVLHEILDEIMDRVEEGGVLILSGFHDIQWHDLHERLTARGFMDERILSGDRSFYGIPPSGSFTWIAAQFRNSA
jgi:ribosomal protein L11 methylase PrmA